MKYILVSYYSLDYSHEFSHTSLMNYQVYEHHDGSLESLDFSLHTIYIIEHIYDQMFKIFLGYFCLSLYIRFCNELVIHI